MKANKKKLRTILRLYSIMHAGGNEIQIFVVSTFQYKKSSCPKSRSMHACTKAYF